jgi:hypothetical protein
VVCRRDHTLPPWYLLTAEPITDADDLWTLVAGVFPALAN